MGKLNKLFESIKNIFNPYEDEVSGDESQVDGLEPKKESQATQQEPDNPVNGNTEKSESTPMEEPGRPSEPQSQEPNQPSEPQSKDPSVLGESAVAKEPAADDHHPESSPAQETPAPEQPKAAPPKVHLGDNVIDTRKKLVNLIVDKLGLISGLSDDSPINMTFYVTDSLIALAMNKEFEDVLRAELENNGLAAFAKGSFRNTKSAAPGIDAIQVIDGLQIAIDESTLEPQQPTLGDAVAVVSLVGKSGSLHASEYELDSSLKTVFHIGRGQVVNRSGVYRENDVAIKEDETAPVLLNINKSVSSVHADIVWKNGAFYLHAMPSGCRPEGGGVTKICRDGKSWELRNSKTYEQLKDGDMIELGDGMHLLFRLKTKRS